MSNGKDMIQDWDVILESKVCYRNPFQLYPSSFFYASNYRLRLTVASNCLIKGLGSARWPAQRYSRVGWCFEPRVVTQ